LVFGGFSLLFSPSPDEVPDLVQGGSLNGTKGEGVSHRLRLWIEYGISLLSFFFEEEVIVADR
jgi:hypothetical protein